MTTSYRTSDSLEIDEQAANQPASQQQDNSLVSPPLS